MSAYYNENDAAAAHVLRCLISDGVIAHGVVDDRSIKDVQPDDLKGFTQCHFFAGGGLWSVAARLAGWPDTRPVWTASCPCQPFSVAGKGAGTDDPRHLWPDFFRLVRTCRPSVIVGEQVAGQAGYGWFDGVRADLASENYASRACDIPACAVDAPHIRQRQWWCAVDDSVGIRRAASWNHDRQYDGLVAGAADQFPTRSVADSEGIDRRPGFREPASPRDRLGQSSNRLGENHVADADSGGHTGWQKDPQRETIGRDVAEWAVRCNGTHWSGAEWIICHDGKARRAQPGIRLLVDGFPGRVGLWRVAGNAISPILAAEVIGALKDTIDMKPAA